MIIGIGVDIVKVKRIKKALERTEGFCKGVFSLEEIAYFSNKNNKYETAAGFFAAKEAFSKALGTGIRGFRLTDIVVKNNSLGKPDIYISNKIKNKFKLEGNKIHLSISHTDEEAIAYEIGRAHV